MGYPIRKQEAEQGVSSNPYPQGCSAAVGFVFGFRFA
jgi:hypothetical protein